MRFQTIYAFKNYLDYQFLDDVQSVSRFFLEQHHKLEFGLLTFQTIFIYFDLLLIMFDSSARPFFIPGNISN
jgi:hypothetical protein